MEERHIFSFFKEQFLSCIITSEVESSIDEDTSHTNSESTVQTLYSVTLEDLSQAVG